MVIYDIDPTTEKAKRKQVSVHEHVNQAWQRRWAGDARSGT